MISAARHTAVRRTVILPKRSWMQFLSKQDPTLLSYSTMPVVGLYPLWRENPIISTWADKWMLDFQLSVTTIPTQLADAMCAAVALRLRNLSRSS